MLKTETNTESMEREIMSAFAAALPLHKDAMPAYEHGQWWVTCGPCGAQWSANDCEPGAFDFEQVTEGDGWCELQGD